MTQAEPGWGNGCVRTSNGPQIHPKKKKTEKQHFIHISITGFVKLIE